MFKKKVQAPVAPPIVEAKVEARVEARSGRKIGEKPVTGAKGKLAYESRRAEKAGMGLEKWMAEKERRVQAEREAIQRAKRKAEPGGKQGGAKPGLLRRLLDRAHRPL